MIVKRECDVQMAEKKNLLPCKKGCSRCIACIEVDEYGQRAHALHGGHGQIDYRLLFRNMRLRQLHEDD